MAPTSICLYKLRAGILALAAAAILFCTPSCFSFRVTVPPDPECVVSTLAIVHSEPAAMDFEKPISDEPVTAADPAVYSLIKVLQVSKPLKLQWHWYSPDNQLIRRSKTVEINAKGKYLAYFAAWDTLPQSYYSEKKGGWTVVITADDSFLSKKEFAVN
ncbi:MAG: hypothetical protein KJ808_01195 [Acidobacteria bacterium]|nr:hypothetical protein [Acidobacteriota bacterium]MBU4306776.1 hypothetical protein [Acidobacteriota bacterium]MBU4405216.1 hypothetical protein [Acidobacteriota bacterium]MCG2812147.1 hypothetical protein [Candidatus Aminicenantes bacterium]